MNIKWNSRHIRINQYDIYSTHVEVGRYYVTARMPKDCNAAFMLNNCAIYRRKGFVWVQIPVENVHSLNLCSSKTCSIRQYWPKEIKLYEEGSTQQQPCANRENYNIAVAVCNTWLDTEDGSIVNGEAQRKHCMRIFSGYGVADLFENWWNAIEYHN